MNQPDWMTELLRELRHMGYELPKKDGAHHLMRGGAVCRDKRGMPILIHATPSDPRARSNLISKLRRAGVVKDVDLRQGSAAQRLQRKQELLAKQAPLRSEVEEMAEILGSRAFLSELVLDQHPLIANNMDAIQQALSVFLKGTHPLSPNRERAVRETLEWLDGQDPDELRRKRPQLERGELEVEVATPEEEVELVHNGSVENEFLSELTKTLRWLNQRIGA